MPKKFTDSGDIDLDREVVLRRDGSRLTEAEAERWGEEIAKRTRAGRPSLSGGRRHSPQIGVRVSDATRAKLEARASAEGKRLSDIVREAIEHYV